MKAVALYEGTYSVDQTKKFVPFDPEKDNPKDRPGSLFINIQPFLVDTGNEVVLLDTGLGYKDENGELILHNNIKNAGYSPDDISKVLISHLHIDHSGGMVQKQGERYVPAFSHASYYVQREDFEQAIAHPSKSYYQPMLEAMQRSGDLVYLEGSGTIDEQIRYELTGAHSPFHQVFLIGSPENGQTCFFGGDVLPEPEQLQRKFMAKYDHDGRRAMELRQEFGERAAREGWVCLFYHSASKVKGTVRLENDAFQIDEA